MKPITLHPGSALLGLAFAGVLAVLAGAAQSPGTAHPIPIRDVRLVGEIPADWWTYMELRTENDGTLTDTYTIPLDHHFVVTKCTLSNSSMLVLADDQGITAPLLGLSQYGGTGNGTRVPLPPGALLTVNNASAFFTFAYLWGYLEPVR